MNTLGFLGTVAATGLGGFDPAPALIGAAALGSRVPRRHVVGFGVALVAGTAVWGMALTTLLGSRVSGVDWHALVRGGVTAAWIELTLGLGVMGYGSYRLHASQSRAAEAGQRRSSPAGLYLTALGFVGIVIFDVPFDILAATAASRTAWQMSAGWVLWAMISQAPLVVLTVAVLLGRHGRLVAMMTRVRERLGGVAHALLSTVLALVGLFLTVDAVRFLALGRFVIN